MVAIALPNRDLFVIEVNACDWFKKYAGTLFDEMFNVLQTHDNQRIEKLFRTLEDKLFELLTTAKAEGSIPEGEDGSATQKPFSEFLAESEDFLLLRIMVALRCDEEMVEKNGPFNDDSESAFSNMVDNLSKVDEWPCLRLKLLFCCLNSLDDKHPQKARVFQKCMEFFGSHVETQLPKDMFDSAKVTSWVSTWTSEKSIERYNVYSTLFNAFSARGYHKEALEMLMEALESGGCTDIVELKSKTINAVVVAIESSETFCYQRIYNLPMVSVLSNEPTTKDLVRVLEVFFRGTLNDFRQLDKSSCFDAFKLSHDKCLRKMKIISVSSEVSLGSPTTHFSLPILSKKLDLPEEEIEEICVAAVSHGLMSCKIDQLQKVVNVGYSLTREFGSEQWDKLEHLVESWKKETDALLHLSENIIC